MRPWELFSITAFILAPALLAPPASGQQAHLPEHPPAPQARPAEADDLGGDMPVPEPRPKAEARDNGSTAKPASKEHSGGDAPTTKDSRTVQSPDADPRSRLVRMSFMPPSEIRCRERLRKAGAVFVDVPAPAPENGCALPYPIALRELPGDVAVEPEAVLNCAMAEAVSEFARDQMSKAASEGLSTRLAAINQASGYVCRPRNGSTRLSEHAFGNALDIAAFRLADGRTIAVAPDLEVKPRAFVDKLRALACGPFRTVLGPGSNADHANHLHLDLAPRKSRTAVCE